MVLISLTFLIFFLLVYVLKYQEKIYLAIVTISIVSSSFIFIGRSIVDEILNTLLAICCLVLLFKNKRKYSFCLKNIKIEILLLVYLILNSFFSLILNSENSKLRNYNESTLRFISIYLAVLIFVITLNTIPQDYSSLIKVSPVLFSVNLYFWVAYWLILEFNGVSWELEQAKTYSGSTYASLVPAFGLLFNLIVLNNNSNKSFKIFFIINYLITLLASFMYSSRVLFGVLVIVAIVIVSQLKKLLPALAFGIIIILVLFTQNIFTPGATSNYPVNINKKLSFFDVEKFNEFKNSITFINSPRLTDSDRSSQIKCSVNLITEQASLKEEVFGFGQSLHKSMMYKCSGLDPSTPGAPARPVGFAAFILDYGLIGISLALVLFFKLLYVSFRNRNFFVSSIILILIPSWLFIANILDHSFIYVVLFLSYIYHFNKQVGVKSE